MRSCGESQRRLMRFVPYVGVWIAAIVPIGLSLAISDNWLAPVLRFGLFVVLELAVSNVLETWLYGKHTGVSPVAVLVAAVAWTWLWGIAGLLLATPLTVCLLVIGKHVPQLSFLTILLGDEPVFETKTPVYQRLPAGDQEEAAELLEERLEHEPLARMSDTVLIPALALTETDWHLGDLNDVRHAFIFQSVKEIIEGLGESQRQLRRRSKRAADETNGDSTSAIPVTSRKPCILCLPARAEADEIAAMMLTQLLTADDWTAQSVAITAQATEIVDYVEEHEAVVICISAMAPAAVVHARHLFRRCAASPGRQNPDRVVGRVSRFGQGQEPHGFRRNGRGGRDAGRRSRARPPTRPADLAAVGERGAAESRSKNHGRNGALRRTK